MSYLADIHKKFLQDIKERPESLFQPYLIHNKVDSDVMFEMIYRNLLEAEKRRTFLVNRTLDKQFKCDDLEKVIQKKKNFAYFTPAVYWHHKSRTKEEVIWLPAIILEFDLTRDGAERNFTADQLAAMILNELEIEVNYIWDTKTRGHYAACILLKPMSGTAQSIYYYESVVKRMAILTGADFASTDAVHLFRIPRKKIYQYTDDVYDIDELAHVLEDERINEMLEQKRREYKGNIVSFSEKQIMNHESIKTLLAAEFTSYRNNAAFTIALLYYALGKSDKEAIDFLGGEWFVKVNDGRISSKSGKFKRKEIVSTVKSAFSGKYSGPSKEWIYYLSGHEFPFNLWKSSYIRKGDEDRKYQRGQAVREKIIAWIRENDGTQIQQKDLAEALEISYRTFQAQIKALKDEGVITFQTDRGRYSKGTTFTYIPNKVFEYEVDTHLNTSLEVYDFEVKKA
ncbi:winged helix-turn-helix domain-containing protein [Bacillus paramycoides]|uniref:winged helix-turn-helix domain-containing protein n=1 Tax=Bacillus paramycoides TaxID=2026194 RepID=UPI002E242A87|nr:winged helix-turn-helix domain-containing protein [Bacillus paramycoides]